MFCTIAGRKMPKPASSALESSVSVPAIQSTGLALPPRGRSFSFSTRYPENAE